MKKLIPFLVISGMLIIGANNSKAEEVCYEDVCFPDGERSFADTVVSYTIGSGVDPTDPTLALGPPDYPGGDSYENYFGLGYEGELVIQFTDNSLTTSGNTNEDLWIFEVGSWVEGTHVAISTDGINWIEVGKTGGNTEGIDIDASISSGVVLGERYSYVRLIDDQNGGGYPDEGADIDAVGAIESAAPVTTTTPDTTTTITEPDTTTTTTISDTSTTTITDCGEYETVCGDTCCKDIEKCCENKYCCFLRDTCCYGDCCDEKNEICSPNLHKCVRSYCLLNAIYGKGSEEIRLLRDFRDDVLSKSSVGLEIIELYYQWSPTIVKAMENDEEFKSELKEIIDGVLGLIGEAE